MKIVILGNPISKLRARYSARGNFVRAYDPRDKEKKMVKAYLTKKIREVFNEGKEMHLEASKTLYNHAYNVRLTFYLPINKTDSLGQKNAKLWGFELPTFKPDLDNLEKFYLDCANEILFPDDSMITHLRSSKHFSLNPRTEIEIMPTKKIKLHEKAEGILKVFDPKTLKEFIEDVKRFEAVDFDIFEELNDESKEIFLTAAACLLSTFSELYSDYFKKIRKYDGLAQDLKNMRQNLKTLGDNL